VKVPGVPGSVASDGSALAARRIVGPVDDRRADQIIEITPFREAPPTKLSFDVFSRSRRTR